MRIWSDMVHRLLVAVRFLGREAAKLRPHKTGPKKKVPTWVHTEDPRVTGQHLSTVMHPH